jgi:site-specific DNA-cytosine methylase
MKERIILDLCGGSGAWAEGYREYNKKHPGTYKVYNITLPEYDLFNTGYEHGGWIVFQGSKWIRINIRSIYGILAAPDCAHFSFARQNAKEPRDIPGAFELIKKCREIWEACALYGNLKFWVCENPRGYLYKPLGKPVFKFKPCEFGDPANKITWLWGNFNFPKKLKNPVSVPIGNNRGSKGYPVTGTKWKRAVTPSGFAKAFFEANR